MILSKTQIKKILDIIKKRHNLFLFKIGLKDQLTLPEVDELVTTYGEAAVHQIEDFLQDGYHIGYLRNTDLGSADDISHAQFKHAPKPKLDAYEYYAVDQGKENLKSYVDKLSQKMQTNYTHLINDYNKRYRDKLMTETVLPVIQQAHEKQKGISGLVTDLRDITGDVARDWDRIARTETTNIINTGHADRILKTEDKHPKDIFVFKRVINDAALCPHCRRLHLSNDGVTPNVYRMSEVLANGNNVGRKASELRMTVGVVHPHCRCILTFLPDGFWFNKEGKLEYVGEKAAKEKIEENLE